MEQNNQAKKRIHTKESNTEKLASKDSCAHSMEPWHWIGSHSGLQYIYIEIGETDSTYRLAHVRWKPSSYTLARAFYDNHPGWKGILDT